MIIIILLVEVFGVGGGGRFGMFGLVFFFILIWLDLKNCLSVLVFDRDLFWKDVEDFFDTFFEFFVLVWREGYRFDWGFFNFVKLKSFIVLFGFLFFFEIEFFLKMMDFFRVFEYRGLNKFRDMYFFFFGFLNFIKLFEVFERGCFFLNFFWDVRLFGKIFVFFLIVFDLLRKELKLLLLVICVREFCKLGGEVVGISNLWLYF